jgi:trk system potassium uptake protein TrkA
MAEKKQEIGVIGLGKFGLRMATTLVSLGHTVVGIDQAEGPVQRAEEALDSVYKADATNIAVLRSLHVQDLDWVVISVGQSVEQSLSITLNVQELGGPKIWVKASNEEHKKILQRLHVNRALVPEMEAAVYGRAPAYLSRHAGPHSKYGGIAIQELRVDQWDGKPSSISTSCSASTLWCWASVR